MERGYVAENDMRGRMVSLVEHGTLLETWQNGLKVWSSKAISDSGWDDFLRRHPHGHHTQSSFWGRVKSGQG